jgi:hypothetical protein
MTLTMDEIPNDVLDDRFWPALDIYCKSCMMWQSWMCSGEVGGPFKFELEERHDEACPLAPGDDPEGD